MHKAAETTGQPYDELVAKYGPEGEFLDPNDFQGLRLRKCQVCCISNFLPPSSQPPFYCKFHYWEEDINTGRVVRRVEGWDQKDGPFPRGSDNSSTVVGYLAWDLNEKFYYPIEWLECLAEEIFKPVRSILNGEIDWCDCTSIGTVRV